MDYPKVKVCLDTSEDNLIDELYTPCLKWAERFDRGVGYFTTGWAHIQRRRIIRLRLSRRKNALNYKSHSFHGGHGRNYWS